MRRFPEGFLWGTATASYQIEGAVDEDGRGKSIWDTFSHTPGKIYRGDTGDVACDHYHRFRDDVALMKELNLNAYRFSVAWPRVLPEGDGPVNEKGVDFYSALVDELLDAGIRPFVTLFHWDLPEALQTKGGFANRDIVEAFARYAEVLRDRIGDRVKDWITLNEPSVYSFMGHVLGVHAPGVTDPPTAAAVAHHLLLAHGRALEVLRDDRSAKVGTTLNLTAVEPASEDDEDLAGARYADALYNRAFLDPIFGRGYPAEMIEVFPPLPVHDGDLEAIAAPLDFLGINYYTRLIARGSKSSPMKFDPVPGDGPKTAMQWEVYPKGLTDVLLRVWKDYGPPIMYVTENGAAYDDDPPQLGEVADPERADYIEAHLGAVADAIDAGAPVGGYFCWSLMDNFEWSFGYSKRFGLIYVDYSTQERVVKGSGRFYSKVAADNALP
jgi:beta-glucosidase